MMPIKFIKPNISENNRSRSITLVKQMTEIIKNLQPEIKNNPKLTLTKKMRQALIKRGLSKSLINYLAFGTQIKISFDGKTNKYTTESIPMVGFASEAFASDLYTDDAIKQTIVTSHAGRCAYCETLISQSQYGDVEHFRPKAAYSQFSDAELIRPGYYQLAYDPMNLFYACGICNQSFKQNFFPVVGPRFPDVALEKEMALFIDPYREDPRRLIRFNPLTVPYLSGWGWPMVEM